MRLEDLKTHDPHPITGEPKRKASVLIPLIETENGPDILFQVRSSRLKHQPGDICFPGGSLEADEGPEDAAIREACEELLITPEQIQLLGPSDYYDNHGRIIYPFAGYLYDYRHTYSPDEVSEVFTVPLSYFMETPPDRYTLTSHLQFPDDFPFEKIYGGREYRWSSRNEDILFWEYEGHVIWGMTAWILHGFIELLR